MTFNYATHGNVPTDDSGTMITPDNCDCEMCGSVVDCNKHNIYILQRGEEDMALCVDCFEDNKEKFKNENWISDDFSDDDEDDE
jgi:ribosome-binding protein aMBF1 (putative translation factor)|tara:strand:+ start:151 stop:402 length:252 start_codon:yes stop_codon:yes gene_type:complete